MKENAKKVGISIAIFEINDYICTVRTNHSCNKLTNLEGKTMKTQKMYNEEEYELDNQYNEEDRYYMKGDSSIWYN